MGSSMGSMVETEPHAVRWARRKVRYDYDWTRWHYTVDASFTACGTAINARRLSGSTQSGTEAAARASAIGLRWWGRCEICSPAWTPTCKDHLQVQPSGISGGFIVPTLGNGSTP